MTGTVTPTIPTLNDPNATEDADVRSSLITLRDALNAILTSANTVDGAQIGAGTIPSTAYADNTLALAKLANQTAGKVLLANSSGVITGTALSGDVTVTDAGVTAIGATKVTNAMLAGSITDAKLLSPNLGVYRTLLASNTHIRTDAVAATYALIPEAVNVSNPFTGINDVPLFYFDDADYTVASKTQKLRLRMQVAANTVSPGITFTGGLYPVTSAGGADALTFTLGTVVTGSTAVLDMATGSPTGGPYNGVGADFTIPSDGSFALGVVTNGTLANNSAALVSAQLQTRHV